MEERPLTRCLRERPPNPSSPFEQRNAPSPVTTRFRTRRNSRRGLDHYRHQRARGGERGRRDGPVLGLRKGQELALKPRPQDWFRQGQCSLPTLLSATFILIYQPSSATRADAGLDTC